MRKIITTMLALALAFSLPACGGASDTTPPPESNAPSSSSSVPNQESTQDSTTTPAEENSTPEASDKILIDYFSRVGNMDFDPKNDAIASAPESTPPADPVTESEGKVMVVYFSATGNTKAVAEVIAAEMDGELYEIVPEEPYTSDDLNWNEPTSRSNKEHEDTSFRPAIAGGIKDLSGYDTIFVGYPLWWGEAPNIVWNFVESSALGGKTVIPFATSLSSGFGSSGETLAGLAPDANWLDGQRFRSGVYAADVQSWVSGLNIN